jgi:hypothetical protein
MSLNSIDFSKKNIADLYKSSLVELNKQCSDSGIKEKQVQLKFLGENKKHVLVVVNYADAVHIPDIQLGFLTNLLSACKLTLADTAVFNFHPYSGPDKPDDDERTKHFNNIISFFKPKTVLLFGIEPAYFGMPLLFPQFQIQSHNNSTFLFTPTLQEMEHDKSLKTKLWICLKKIFSL